MYHLRNTGLLANWFPIAVVVVVVGFVPVLILFSGAGPREACDRVEREDGIQQACICSGISYGQILFKVFGLDTLETVAVGSCSVFHHRLLFRTLSR